MKEILGAIRNGFSSQNLRIGMSDHSGTHIDQLNHVGIKQENGE
jgi:kynurenine formamidase